MPLTLECNCDPNASICLVTDVKLTIGGSSFNGGPDTLGAFTKFEAFTAAGSLATLIGEGSLEVDIFTVPNILDYLESGIQASLYMDASLNQVPSEIGSSFYGVGYTATIAVTYSCFNFITGETTTTVGIYGVEAEGEVRCEGTVAGVPNVLKGLISGVHAAVLYASTSVTGPCLSGAIINYGGWSIPNPARTVNLGGSGQVCVCATGGSGDYVYSVVAGNLPCGQSLNSRTGCIEGTPNGTCAGSDAVTFRVTDLGGAGIGGPTSQVIAGTARTFGHGVTWLSGGPWTNIGVGDTITVNGTVCHVTSIVDPTNIFVDVALPVLTVTDWSMTIPIVPVTSPTPPETAEVTCGFIAPNDCGSESSIPNHFD